MRQLHSTFLPLALLTCLVGYVKAGAISLPVYRPSPSPPRTTSHSAIEATDPSVLKRSTVLAKYRERHFPFGIFVPIAAAAAELELVLTEISSIATDSLAMGFAESPSFEIGLDSISMLILSSDPWVPVPWQFIVHLTAYLIGEVSKGWTGDYKAQWVDKVTGVSIGVKMLRSE
ncbi:MAG: hypothetical protein Q9218_005845 [Villophora microphyllina]